MKTKITLLIALIGLSLSSCVKDYIGHGSDKIILTSDNNMYEGDLYQTFLSIEIEDISAKISVLEDVIQNNQGTEQTENDLEVAKLLRNNLQVEQSTIPSPDRVSKRIPKPLPPCPKLLNCSFLNLLFVTSLNETKIKTITISDANGKEIGGTTGNLNVLSGTNGKVIIDDFKMDMQYTGAITVRVITEGKKRLMNTYTFNSFIEK